MKTLTGYGKKVDILIQPFNHVEFLDCLIGHIFRFKTIVYGPKLELKQVRYHKNTKTLIKSSLYFSGKLVVFYPTSRNKLYRLGKNRNEWAQPS